MQAFLMGLTSEQSITNGPARARTARRSVPFSLLSSPTAASSLRSFLLLQANLRCHSAAPHLGFAAMPTGELPLPLCSLTTSRLSPPRNPSRWPHPRGLTLESAFFSPVLLISLVRLSRRGTSLLDSICLLVEEELWDQNIVAPSEFGWLVGISRRLRDVSLRNIGFGNGQTSRDSCGAPRCSSFAVALHAALALLHGAYGFTVCRYMF